MFFKSKYHFSRKPKYYSTVDNVERESYIPLEIQYERLMMAGAQRELDNANLYYYEYNDFVNSNKSIQEFAGDNLHPQYMDKSEAFSLAKVKAEKIKEFRKQSDLIEKYKSEFDKLQVEKEYKRRIINEYKAEQDRLNKESI